MLQGGVAIGVGAAAWAAPNINSLGFTPAYAQACTNPGPVTTHDSSTSSEVTCIGDGCGFSPGLAGSVSGPAPGGDTFTVTGGCANGSDTFGVATDSGSLCRVIRVRIQGLGGENFAVTGNVIPDIGETFARCARRWVIRVECVPAGSCFP